MVAGGMRVAGGFRKKRKRASGMRVAGGMGMHKRRKVKAGGMRVAGGHGMKYAGGMAHFPIAIRNAGRALGRMAVRRKK